MTAQTLLDLSPYRAQFPALSMRQDQTPLVFFDNPGGTQVPESVANAMRDYLLTANANVHGPFLTSRRTDEIIAEAHAAMADLLNAASPDEIIFGQNMTSLTFAISRSLGRELLPGDEIVVTALDHDANIAPWLALQERGVEVRWVDVDPVGCTLDYEQMERSIGERTKIVAVGMASNAVGTINDLARIVELARSVGALVFVDAVQGVPHLPVDVQALGCDFLACSAYKFFGPHQGIVWGKREHLERFHAYKVRPAPNELPGKWETGTQNHEGQAGTLAAVEYLAATTGITTARRRRRCPAGDGICGWRCWRSATTSGSYRGIFWSGCRTWRVWSCMAWPIPSGLPSGCRPLQSRCRAGRHSSCRRRWRSVASPPGPGITTRWRWSSGFNGTKAAACCGSAARTTTRSPRSTACSRR
jgi:cysteine desulfurase family protein (TIGR01976 family)